MSLTLKKWKLNCKPTGILFFVMLYAFCGYGQDSAAIKQEVIPPRKYTISIADTVMKVNNKDLKDITVHVRNTDQIPFKGYLYLHSNKGARIATKDSVAINLEPGKEIFVPAKIYVNQGTQEGTIFVGIALRNLDKVTLDTITLNLLLAPSRLLTASVDAEDMVLPKVGTNLSIPIHINNRGNVSQGGVMVIAFPSALKDKVNTSIYFKVEPFKDTLIIFQRKVSRDMAKLGFMNVTINGIYDDGNIFAANLITFQNLSNKRTFEEGLSENNMIHNNVISVGVQNAFDVGETYNVRARGFYDIKDGEVGFNFNMMKWKSGTKALSLNGTNLDLAYKQVGFHVGNVTQSGDLSFTGRGGDVYAYTDSAHRNKFFVGYLDKSVNLYSTDPYQSSYGSGSWVGYKYEKQTLQSLTTFMHDEDKINKIKSDLLVSNLTWKASEHFSGDLKGAVANSVSTLGNNESHPSFAAGFNFYAYYFDKLNITGNNAYATSYYPGARRGMLYLNEGAFLRLNKSTISTSVIYSNSAPKYFNQSSQQFNNQDENITWDITYALSKGAISLAVSPQFYTENGYWLYNGINQNGDMTAGRVSLLFAVNPVKVQQSLYFKTDIGAYNTGFDNENHLQFKSMLTYSFKNFRLVGNIQKGNYFLAEVFQEYFASYNSFRLNIAPSITTYFFNKALKFDGGVAYNKDYYSNSFLLNGNLIYNLGPASFFTNFQYNIYNQSRTYKNIQFGVNYFLPDNQAGKIVNKAKIELFLYYDLNKNNAYDAGDSVASGILMHVGKTIMMTGGDGKLVYSKLPPGNYSAYMPTQNGWYGRDQFITLKEKETKKISIALNQTGTVHGNITYQFDSTYSFSINRDKAWQTIVAINQEGQRFDTKTDENGNYNLYLPVGTYTVNVDNLPNQIELLLTNNNVQPLKVDAGQIINGVDFILKVKQRKVEIKKFGKPK